MCNIFLFNQALQKCFESRDIPLLMETIKAMPEEEARYHLKRCVDSGLWVPDASKVEGEASTEADGDGNTDADAAAASSSTESKPNVSTEDVD